MFSILVDGKEIVLSGMSTDEQTAVLEQIRKNAVAKKKCYVCSNPHCPYPSDEEFGEKAKDKEWLADKDCFIPFPEDLGKGGGQFVEQ
ncbi:MAG: hypothetical protein AB1523_09755 [Bacillota bacterium]